jgi:hypothetical protein
MHNDKREHIRHSLKNFRSERHSVIQGLRNLCHFHGFLQMVWTCPSPLTGNKFFVDCGATLMNHTLVTHSMHIVQHFEIVSFYFQIAWV